MIFNNVFICRILAFNIVCGLGLPLAAQAGRGMKSRFSIAFDEAQKEAARITAQKNYLAQFSATPVAPPPAISQENLPQPQKPSKLTIAVVPDVEQLQRENEALKKQIAQLHLTEASQLLKENEKLKQEIARLKETLTLALKNAATGELAPDAASDDLMKKIEEFKADYKSKPNQDVADILELLDTERKDKIALDVYSFIMDTFQTVTDETRYEKIITDLAKFTDHHYTGKLIEKYESSTKEQLRRASIAAAEDVYKTWRNHAQLKDEVEDSPALNLILVDEKNFPFIKKDVWPYLTNLLKYSSIEHLNAVIHYLGTKVILKPNPADWISKFFVSLEEHIDRRKDKEDQQEGIKFRGHVKNSFAANYKGEITKYFGKDYAFMQATAKTYRDTADQYFVELMNNPQQFEERAKKSPILYLLHLPANKLGQIKDDLYEPLKDYVKYANLEDLQATCYKFTQGGYLIDAREAAPRFANYIYSEIQSRQREGQKPITEMSKQDIKVFAQKYKPKLDAFRTN